MVILISAPFASAEEAPNKQCPMMTGDEVEAEDWVACKGTPAARVPGSESLLLQRKAKAAWEKNPEAVAKKAIDAGLLPQLKKAA